MKSILIEKIGGLDNVNADHNIAAGNAVQAQFWDPFRVTPDKLAPCFGFMASAPSGTQGDGWPVTDTNGAEILAGFMFGGYECYIFKNAAGIIKLGYITIEVDQQDPDQYPIRVFRNINDLGDNEDSLDFVPSKIVIDDNPYSLGDPEDVDYYEFFNLYLYGYNETTDNHIEPLRILLTKNYANPGDAALITWQKTNLSIYNLIPQPASLLFITPHGPSSWGGSDVYHYFLILEDIEGNLYSGIEGSLNDENSFHKIYDTSVTDIAPDIAVSLTEINLKKYHISRGHVYRVNYTDENTTLPLNTIQELFARARWLATFDYLTNQPYYDSNDADTGLGDNVYPGWDELINWQKNANTCPDAIGKHNGALWIGKGAEVRFSAYTLEAPYGARLLNFPSENRWRFEDIGDIVDLVSVNNALVVFGTQGIKTLSGTYLDNFYEQRVSDIGVLKPRPGKGEWINPITVIEDKIFFINNEGYPCIYYNSSVQEIRTLRISLKGSVNELPGQAPDSEYVFDPIDTCRYRNGWFISNGTTVYVLDIETGRWYEWPIGVHRFIQGIPAYYEDISLRPSGANEFRYFKYISNVTEQYPYVYATDGTIQTSYYKIPKIDFDYDVLVRTITLFWEYKLIYNYEDKDMDDVARTAQSVVMALDIYTGDSDDSVKTVSFTPSQAATGKYRSTIYINVKCRKLAFRLSGSAIKYFRLTGYQINYEPRGRKTYD